MIEQAACFTIIATQILAGQNSSTQSNVLRSAHIAQKKKKDRTCSRISAFHHGQSFALPAC
jgi:hypothetical protein